jgi:hypothetical protein
MEEEMKRIFLTILVIMVSVSWGYAANLKVSELTETQTLTDNDLFLVSTYSGGAYTSKYIKKNYLVTSLGITNNAATMTVIDTTDATAYVALFDSATGNLPIKTDTKITFNATTGILTATGFAGPLTGAVTGNAGTATALAANPTDCASLGVATAIDARGNLTCGYSIGTNIQAYDAELAALAGLTSAANAIPYFTGSGTAGVISSSANMVSLLGSANYATARTNLGLAIGTNVQAYDAELAALAGLTSAANAIPYFTGSGTAGVISSSADMVSLLGSADYATALTNLGGQASDSALTSLSSKVFAKTALTGAGGLDTVLYDDIADGDIGMVGTVAGVIYWYVFEASSSTAESSPAVIAPDDVGVNNGRWLLKLYCDGSSCSIAQGAVGGSSKWLEGSANGTDYMQLKADDDVGTNRKIVLSTSVTDAEDLSIQLGANDNTVTIGSSTSADSIIGLNSYSLGSAGVKLTGDGDGAITFLGLGNGYDEDLTLNLDDTENTASISSSTGVTSISLGSIGMVTTGTIQGAIKVNTDNNGMSQGEMTTAGVYGAFYVASGAGTWNLPAVASGMNICIYSTTAAAVVVNPDNGDTITLNGTALSAGDSITSASGAGDFICLIGVSDSSWLTLGRSGTWTDTN